MKILFIGHDMAFIILFQIRQIVNEHTSAESQKTVDSILDQV